VTYRAIRRDEINDSLKLILATGATLAGDAQVVDFLRYAVERGIDLNDMWVACRGDRPVWTTLPVLSPGRTMLLLMPDNVLGAPPEAPPALVSQVCEHFQSRGIRLAQAILEPEAPIIAALCQSAGFSRLAELTYLQIDIRRSPITVASDIQWQTYTSQTHDDFAQTVMETYEQSLDCPSLTGMRDIEDILAGHKSSGEFHPDLWLLARDKVGKTLAVLLMAVLPGGDSMELVYLGVCPTARGRGAGKALFRQAMTLAQSHKLPRMTLAVDSHNTPALKLYFGQGMRRICTKTALLRDLRLAMTPSLVPADPSSAVAQDHFRSA
jgi:ribosomal protein S18 acetylase RimI-like enzyme